MAQIEMLRSRDARVQQLATTTVPVPYAGALGPMSAALSCGARGREEGREEGRPLITTPVSPGMQPQEQKYPIMRIRRRLAPTLLVATLSLGIVAGAAEAAPAGA